MNKVYFGTSLESHFLIFFDENGSVVKHYHRWNVGRAIEEIVIPEKAVYGIMGISCACDSWNAEMTGRVFYRDQDYWREVDSLPVEAYHEIE